LTTKPPELVEPDERWQMLAGDRAALAELAAGWTTDEHVPGKIASMLQVSRALFVNSYFVYEFGAVAVVWSVFALEAALRGCLGSDAADRDGLTALIRKAEKRGWFTAAQAEALEAGAKLRNRLVHAEGQKAFSPGIVAELLAVAHQAVADLYRSARPPS
jgi:hypothetical protein